jgi:hypothetical protein
MNDDLNNVLSAVYDAPPTIEDITDIGITLLDSLANLVKQNIRAPLFIRFVCTVNGECDTAHSAVDFCILEKDGYKVRYTTTVFVDGDLVTQSMQLRYPQNQWDELLRLIQITLSAQWERNI